MSNEANPRKLAFIIDGTLVDILHTDDRLAAIFLSEPKILDITDKIDQGGVGSILVGSTYDEATDSYTQPNL